MRSMSVAGLAGGLVVLGLLAGCTANGASSGTADSGPVAVAPNTLPLQRSAGSAGTGESANSGSANSGSVNSGGSGSTGSKAAAPLVQINPGGRQVIRTATISLTTHDVFGTVSRAQGLATTAGGYTATENADSNQATLTLEVPEPQLDAVLNQLAGLGQVTDRQAQAQDVTDQLVDVRSRIASQQASVDRVRALLSQASSIGDIVSIEGELTKRESDLESLEQQQAELAGQVAMSAVTVTITLAPPVGAPPPAPTQAGFGSGLAGGWHALGATVRVVGIVLGAALPFLLAVGIPVAAVLIWLRRRRGQVNGRGPGEISNPPDPATHAG